MNSTDLNSFSTSLNQRLNTIGVPLRGRAAFIQHKLPLKASIFEVRQWLIGEAYPDVRHREGLTQILGVELKDLANANANPNYAPQDLKPQICDYLHALLEVADIPVRNRASLLFQLLNEATNQAEAIHYDLVTIRKWLLGELTPSKTQLEELSVALGMQIFSSAEDFK